MNRTKTAVERSNAARAVGHRVSVRLCHNGPYKDGIVVAFNQLTGEQTIDFDDGQEKIVVLNCLQFRWLTEPAIEGVVSLNSDRLFRLHMAENREAVGRTLRICLKSRGEWFDGTIVRFCEQSGKHRINLESLKRERELSLIPGEFRWTDLVGCQHSRSDTHTLSTPRYMGVQRYSATRWRAFRSNVGVHYIGTFASEKDAALAYDVYARQKGRPVNFTSEKVSEAEIKQRRTTEEEIVHQRSQFDGVYWQRKPERWVARWRAPSKYISLGTFLKAEHAALAFDAEARKHGWPEANLNFPALHVPRSSIEERKMKTVQFAMMKPEHEKSSRYRGVAVTSNQPHPRFHVQIGIKKVVAGLGKAKGPVSLGNYSNERQAALAYDQVCRRYGVPEKELNFPRDRELKEVRLFDDECYYCCRECPVDPVATPCNHIFCRPCVNEWLGRTKKCPCCQTPVPSKSALRSVDLVSQPEMAASKSAPNEVREHHGSAPDGEETRHASETGPSVGVSNETQEATKQVEEMNVTSFVNIKRKAGSALKVAVHTRKKRRNAPENHKQLVSPRVKVEFITRSRDAKEGGNVSQGRDSSTRSKSEWRGAKLPRFSVGTRFRKEFPGHVVFQGTITSFDGEHYRIYYPYGGDAENLSDSELDGVEIIETPTSRLATLDKLGSMDSSQDSKWWEQHWPDTSITKDSVERDVESI
jgi:hypothetical protein